MRAGRKTYLKKKVIHVKLVNEEAANDAGGEGLKWRFVKKLKRVFGHRLYVPKKFATGTGLAKREEVEVENEEGRRWTVGITNWNRGMYCLGRGWRDFLGANGVKAHSILVFEYVRGVVKVVVADKEGGEAMLARALKGGFLPFLYF